MTLPLRRALPLLFAGQLLVGLGFALIVSCSPTDAQRADAGDDSGPGDGSVGRQTPRGACDGVIDASVEASLEAGQEQRIPFQELKVTVTDTKDVPLASVPVAVCGKNVCTTTTETVNGFADVVAAPLNLDRPTVYWGDGLLLPLLGLRIDQTSSVTLRTTRLTNTGRPITSGASIHSDGITLTLPADLTPNFAASPFDIPEKQTLRVAIIARNEAKLLAPDQDFDFIVALGPSPVALCGLHGGATLAFDQSSDAGLPMIADVDLYQFELDANQPLGTFGEWVAVSPERGLRTLSSVGIRKKKGSWDAGQ